MVDFQNIAFALITLVFGWVINDIKKNKESINDHEKRIQHVEDLHGRDIDEIKKLLKELSEEVKAMNKYVHRENHDLINLVTQQKNAIDLVNKHINEIFIK